MKKASTISIWMSAVMFFFVVAVAVAAAHMHSFGGNGHMNTYDAEGHHMDYDQQMENGQMNPPSRRGLRGDRYRDSSPGLDHPNNAMPHMMDPSEMDRYHQGNGMDAPMAPNDRYRNGYHMNDYNQGR